jgi:hypothetical protein
VNPLGASDTFAFYQLDGSHKAYSYYAGVGPVRQFVITGDTRGSDIGKTLVEIRFNELAGEFKSAKADFVWPACRSAKALRRWAVVRSVFVAELWHAAAGLGSIGWHGCC